MKYEIKKINGITTIFSYMDTNSITIEIGVKAGAVYETRKNNGISHFLEHMFFKGGKKYNNPKKVVETIDDIGGEFNASTGREQTSYYVKVAPEYIDIAIDLLSDMLVYPLFDENEIEKEKGVIIQELKMNQDNPRKVLIDKFVSFYYGDNPYGWPIIGTEENILSFKRQDFLDYKNSLYTKDNIVISVAGKIENQKQIEKQIEELFVNLPDKKTGKKAEFEGIKAMSNEGFFEKKVEQNHMVLNIPGFSINDEKRYEMSLLATILGGNMSSILFQELREKMGLCYYIGANHYSNDEDGLLFISAGIDKQNFKKAIEKINQILDEVQNGNITLEQLNKAKGYFAGKTKMGIETSDELASFVLDQYISRGEITSLEETLKKINSIQLEDIKKVASEKLGKENRYLYYLK